MKPLSAHWSNLKIETPALHIVLGSGLSSAFGESSSPKDWIEAGTLSFAEVEGLLAPTAPGHRGVYRYYRHAASGRTLCFQVGRLHGYEGHSPRDVVRTVMIPRMAGTKSFLLTNAAGSLRKENGPGSLMVLTDHVNLTGTTPLEGTNPVDASGKPLGERFPDMSAVYDKPTRERLKKALARNGHAVSEGVYLGLRGPAYETPAEVKLFASWGMGAVGMSTVWEAVALRHAGSLITGLSFLSNLGCGLSDAPLSHEEVEREGKKIARKLVDSLFAFAGEEFSRKE